jgi:hypothetical protein
LLAPGIDLRAALSLATTALWLPVGLWAAGAAALLWAARSRRAARLPLLVLALDLGFFARHMGAQGTCPVGVARQASFALEPYTGRYFPTAASPYPYYGDYGVMHQLQVPDLSALAGIRTVNGYDAFVYRRFNDLTAMDSSGYTGDERIWRPGFRAFDVLGLRMIGVERKLLAKPTWQTRLAGDRWHLDHETADAVFYVQASLPRAWRPAAWTQLAADEVDRRLTGTVPFNPLETALLEEPMQAPTIGPGTVTATSLSPNRIRLETDGEAGLVVLSESFDPGWHATLAGPGTSLPLHRTDALVMGIEVPAGRQTVMLSYQPRLWREGLLASLGALLALLALLVAHRPRGR